MSNVRIPHFFTALVALSILFVAPLAASDAQPYDDASAFAALQALAGDWQGTYGDGDAAIRFEVTSGGNTVVAVEFPGQHHEMRTLFWLDEGRLVAQHFCMLGNQPQYRFVPSEEPGLIDFEFAGGTNLDPAKDEHAHETDYRILSTDRFENSTTFWKGGAESEKGTMTMERAR